MCRLIIIDCGSQMQAAEVAFQREQNELEIARAKELSEIEVSHRRPCDLLEGDLCCLGKKIP